MKEDRIITRFGSALLEATKVGVIEWSIHEEISRGDYHACAEFQGLTMKAYGDGIKISILISTIGVIKITDNGLMDVIEKQAIGRLGDLAIDIEGIK